MSHVDQKMRSDQMFVYTGVETLVEGDGASVSDIDTNAVIGLGATAHDVGIGCNLEVGGIYFDSTELSFYPGDRADIEKRLFMGIAAIS